MLESPTQGGAVLGRTQFESRAQLLSSMPAPCRGASGTSCFIAAEKVKAIRPDILTMTSSSSSSPPIPFSLCPPSPSPRTLVDAPFGPRLSLPPSPTSSPSSWSSSSSSPWSSSSPSPSSSPWSSSFAAPPMAPTSRRARPPPPCGEGPAWWKGERDREGGGGKEEGIEEDQ